MVLVTNVTSETKELSSKFHVKSETAERRQRQRSFTAIMNCGKKGYSKKVTTDLYLTLNQAENRLSSQYYYQTQSHSHKNGRL